MYKVRARTILTEIAKSLQKRGHYSRAYETDIVREWIRPREGDALLDVGCGEAQWTVDQLPTGSTIFGLDRDFTALRAASARGLKVVAGTAEHLPFEDGSFDKAISVCAIEHFESDELAVAELRRVLRPAGILGLTADSYCMRGISEDFVRWHRQRFDVARYYNLEKLSGLLERHGFLVTDARYLVCTEAYVRLGLHQLSSEFSVLSLCLGVALNPVMRRMDHLVGSREAGLKVALRGVRVA